MTEAKIDSDVLQRHLNSLIQAWKNPEGEFSAFSNVDALCFVSGSSNSELLYQKTPILQLWLLGYEFPNTIIAISDDTVYIVASPKKAKLLKDAKPGDSNVKWVILEYLKGDSSANEKTFQEVVDGILASKNGKRIGFLMKDTFEGKFINEWNGVLQKSEDKFEKVDVSPAIATLLSVKEQDELKLCKIAAKLSSCMMQNCFANEMEDILDQEKSITHEALSTNVDSALYDQKAGAKYKLPPAASQDFMDWCYSPIIQSGGNYNLLASAVSDENKLHAGTILCSLGVRYKSYCSNIGRTFMISPTKAQEKNYQFLLDLQKHVLGLLKPGTPFSAIHPSALAYIREKRPDLEKNFVKNCGFAMGMEFRDSTRVLSQKSTATTIKADMVINLSLGFNKLENPQAKSQRSKIYALMLIDSVIVMDSGAQLITSGCKLMDEMCFYFKDEGEDDRAKTRASGAGGKSKPATRQSVVLASKFRSEERDDDSNEKKRKLHQKELAERIQQEGLQKFSHGSANKGNSEEQTIKKFESYKRETALPKEVSNCRIYVDNRADSIILPVYGMAVPFHISTLKNISKSDEGEYVYLRFNFNSPGQGVGKKDSLPISDPNATFMRSVTIRSSDILRMNEMYTSIQNLKKDQAKRETEKAQLADIVEQDKLVAVRGRRPLRLPDVFARPSFDNKRVPGELEIHTNGIRFVHPLRTESRIDVLFNNIKHLFFQRCDGEIIVIIHIHLKNPIMIGKKKVKDIQFYRETTDSLNDETGNRKRKYRYGDEDEVEAENEERRRRHQLNKEFQSFAKKIAEASDNKVDVDTPFREAGFTGVPFRSNVLLQPTVDCLVHLSDPPFFVVTMSDIEIVHLERVQFGLKNFDMVFVFKDYKKSPVHVNTIPMKQLDDVKEWLDSVNICFSEGHVNLNWTTIMKTVNDDPEAFFLDGGWSFLQEGSDEEEEDEEDEESEFSMSEDELGSSESSDDPDESAFGTDEEEEESGDYSEEDEVSSADDWDALEEKAKREDEHHRLKHGAGDDKSGYRPAKAARNGGGRKRVRR
ncbi:FACT complex subunit spt16 [Mycoemilia scoparia]|uniref:FACT complex subunit n=1 Tax=Mycoemilia scoparia TaxID=417184 RepID=A0A9W8A3A2_9FUNG|nr:FACT complex subunit spt16 [Mycoemilia scoparia]